MSKVSDENFARLQKSYAGLHLIIFLQLKVIVVHWDDETVQHPDNLLKIPHWNGNDDDHALLDLAAFLKSKLSFYTHCIMINYHHCKKIYSSLVRNILIFEE